MKGFSGVNSVPIPFVLSPSKDSEWFFNSLLMVEPVQYPLCLCAKRLCLKDEPAGSVCDVPKLKVNPRLGHACGTLWLAHLLLLECVYVGTPFGSGSSIFVLGSLCLHSKQGHRGQWRQRRRGTRRSPAKSRAGC